MNTIEAETEDINSFIDIFSGTASVASKAMKKYDKVITKMNSLLKHSEKKTK